MKQWLLALFWLLLVASGLTPRVAAHQLTAAPADAVGQTPPTLRRRQPVLLPPATLAEPQGQLSHPGDSHPLLLGFSDTQTGAFSAPLIECPGFSLSHRNVACVTRVSGTPSRAPPAP